MPLVDYGSVVWGSTSSSNLEWLLKLQKRAARIILKADSRIPSVDMFQELGWLSVESRLTYTKEILTYKAINNMTPEYISNMLKPISQMHSLNLRSRDNGILNVPMSRTTLCDGAFSCSAPKFCNSLPQSVRNCDTLNSFKKCLKTVI